MISNPSSVNSTSKNFTNSSTAGRLSEESKYPGAVTFFLNDTVIRAYADNQNRINVTALFTLKVTLNGTTVIDDILVTDNYAVVLFSNQTFQTYLRPKVIG
jgi:hypothetical protein